MPRCERNLGSRDGAWPGDGSLETQDAPGCRFGVAAFLVYGLLLTVSSVLAQEERDYYDFERLWRDAPTLEWEGEPGHPDAVSSGE